MDDPINSIQDALTSLPPSSARAVLNAIGDQLFGDDYRPELMHLESAQDYMELATGLHAEITGRIKEVTQHIALLADCRAGCTACCNQIVPLTLYEAIVIAPDAGAFDENVRKALGHTADEMWPKLIEADFFALRVHTPNLFPSSVHTLWRVRQGVCPFLKDGRCSVYEYRPLRCQVHFVRQGFRHLCSDDPKAAPTLSTDYAQVIQGLASRCFQMRALGFARPMKPLPMPIAIAFACRVLNHGGPAVLEMLGLSEAPDVDG